mgnify:CR=1 FL=1
MGKYKICVYTIAKNEEKFVSRFMESAAEADCVCVLDTGSTDSTTTLLQQAGAIVETEVVLPWRFDTARNHALALVPDDVDICVSIDLDECFHPGWREKLESVWQDNTDRASYRYTWSFNTDGSEGHVFFADKIHARHGYCWVNPVHEILKPTDGRREHYVRAEGVQLDHRADPSKSRGQYLPLLELSVSENPHNDRNMHYLGREYMFHGEYGRAIETLTRHLAMPEAVWVDERAASMRFIARCLRAQNQAHKAAGWYLRAIAEAPHLREAYTELAGLYYEMENWTALLAAAEAALAIESRPETYINEAFAWGSLPYDFASIAWYRVGNLDMALLRARQALTFAGPEDVQRISHNIDLILAENAK